MANLEVHDNKTSNIVFYGGNVLENNEMLRITEDGFWVRGVKVEQGPEEAQAVYNAFTQWMAWSSLNRQY